MFNDYPFYGVALKLMQCEKGHLLSPHTFQMNMIFKKMVKFSVSPSFIESEHRKMFGL